MRTLFPLIMSIALIGCGPKKAPEAVVETKAEITAPMPDTSDARSFAEALIENGIKDWSPTGSRDFKWLSASFNSDGSLKVQAKIEAGDEIIECPETGTWLIDSTESKTSGIIEWTVTKTSCASRENGVKQRVQLSFSGSETKISFR